MNAAAKAINQSNLFTGNIAELHLSKLWCIVLSLVFAVFISSLAIIYSTNDYRLNFSQLQLLEQQTQQLQLQWSQLLLEQASLATPARIEAWASQKLGMQLPDSKRTYLLQAR